MIIIIIKMKIILDDNDGDTGGGSGNWVDNNVDDNDVTVLGIRTNKN